jgi:hypothetical protein
VTSRLNEEDHAFALALGDGGDALGIRRAVKIAAALGLEKAREVYLLIEAENTSEDTAPKKRRANKATNSQNVTHVEEPKQPGDNPAQETTFSEPKNEGMRHGA